MIKRILFVVLLLLFPVSNSWGLAAFPGAEGWGSDTIGGRGGSLYKVTNLNNSGEGSLRAALEAEGARVVVFEVSGTITLSSIIYIYNPYITIAGETAPSPGILVKGHKIEIRTHDVIIRHLRVRVGDVAYPEANVSSAIRLADCSEQYDVYNVVIDHCSLGWASDVLFSMYGWSIYNVSLTNCILHEGLEDSNHSSAPSHNYGLTFYGKYWFAARNLIAHNKQRHPFLKAQRSYGVFLNNYIYNYGDIISNIHADNDNDHLEVSYIANYCKDGPDVVGSPYFINCFSGDNAPPAGSEIYLEDNYIDGVLQDTLEQDCDDNEENILVGTPPMEWTGQTELAYDAVWTYVSANAGARPADRDSVDTRIVTEVGAGTGGWKDAGEEDWPTLAENSGSFTDPGTAVQASGYTAREEYIHALAGCVEGDTTAPVISGGVPSGEQQCTGDPRNITLQITTDELATCKYDTSDDTYANLSNTFTTTGGTSHSQTISLACDASYTYYCRCQDTCENANSSSTSITFSIESSPPPPVNVTGACYGGGVSGGSM